mmetsp:Transcript_11075/g.25524  ORF Transcript_11075/g.25524 Transcript_11075/m.25524 type:complete len:112 (-) Transcript_11075:733-1068(-)
MHMHMHMQRRYGLDGHEWWASATPSLRCHLVRVSAVLAAAAAAAAAKLKGQPKGLGVFLLSSFQLHALFMDARVRSPSRNRIDMQCIAQRQRCVFDGEGGAWRGRLPPAIL